MFEVPWDGRERIKLKTYKDFVSVSVEQGQNKHFGGTLRYCSSPLASERQLRHHLAATSSVDELAATGARARTIAFSTSGQLVISKWPWWVGAS
jgi:hypothetical protein